MPNSTNKANNEAVKLSPTAFKTALMLLSDKGSSLTSEQKKYYKDVINFFSDRLDAKDRQEIYRVTKGSDNAIKSYRKIVRKETLLGSTAHIAGRREVFDGVINGFIEKNQGKANIIYIGSGMVDDAYRKHRKYPNVNFVECDVPDMSAAKKEVLSNIGKPIARNLCFEPVMLGAKGDIGDFKGKLKRLEKEKSFDPKLPTLLVGEGVFEFPPKNAVNKMFKELSSILKEGGSIGKSGTIFTVQTGNLTSFNDNEKNGSHINRFQQFTRDVTNGAVGIKNVLLYPEIQDKKRGLKVSNELKHFLKSAYLEYEAGKITDQQRDQKIIKVTGINPKKTKEPSIRKSDIIKSVRYHTQEGQEHVVCGLFAKEKGKGSFKEMESLERYVVPRETMISRL